MQTRVLNEADLPAVERFLAAHADSSMILRGNLLLDGIEDRGGRWAGVYAGAFDAGGALRAVAAHYLTGGNLVPQADSDQALDAAVACAVAASGQPVRGVLGPRALVRRARSQLNLDGTPARYDGDEGLYALELAQLSAPPLLGEPGVGYRAWQPGDAELYLTWYRDYEAVSLGAADDAALSDRLREKFQRVLLQGERCVLTRDGVPCATSTFNARLPDMVQVGGVYTPPPLRSRGYARAAVAQSLLDARARGARRAILFTEEHNVPAIRAYRALGFERIGDFAIVLF